MRRFLATIAALLAAMAAPLSGPLYGQTAGAPKATMPTVTSYALDKSKVTLPADLAGGQNVLVLYFAPDQSDAALAWVKGLEAIRSARSNFQSYILPVYSRENYLYRWWIDASTRSAAPASQDWHTTIPIFVDKQAFYRPLGVTSEKQPFIVLTDKAGHVEWKTQGGFEQWKADQLASEMGGSPQAPASGHISAQ